MREYNIPDYYDASAVAEASYRARYEEEQDDYEECPYEPAERECDTDG